MRYRIWSIQHTAWWKPGEHGYTTSFDCAGIYEEALARDIVYHANYACMDRQPPREALVPVEMTAPPNPRTT